jgi:hypothetical protein
MWMSDEVKNGPQLRIGVANEILSEGDLSGGIMLPGNSSARPHSCSRVEVLNGHSNSRRKLGIVAAVNHERSDTSHFSSSHGPCDRRAFMRVSCDGEDRARAGLSALARGSEHRRSQLCRDVTAGVSHIPPAK